MTIREHISTIRFIINKYDDDTKYSDPQIYSLLISAGAIMNQRKDAQKKKLSDWRFNYYKMGMEKGSPYGEDCIGIGCEEWISKFKIPTPLTGRNKDLIDIRTLDGRPINKVSLNDSANELDPVLNNSITYKIVNQYVVLNKKIKAILIGGIWEDVTDWTGIQLCDDDGNVTDKVCFSLDNDEFPVDADYHFMMYDEVLRQLGLRLRIGEIQNITNNQNHAG